MSDRLAAERACKDANPIIDGRKANVNLAYLGAKPRGNLQSGIVNFFENVIYILFSSFFGPVSGFFFLFFLLFSWLTHILIFLQVSEKKSFGDALLFLLDCLSGNLYTTVYK
jgi:hypothetical protein